MVTILHFSQTTNVVKVFYVKFQHNISERLSLDLSININIYIYLHSVFLVSVLQTEKYHGIMP